MVDPAAFVKGCSLVSRAIRLRADAAWDPEDSKLKFASFCSEFPEVEGHQFLWACEQWVQRQAGGKFLMFPSWRELMAALYRCEAGLANRSWGPRPDLPLAVAFNQQQRALMPAIPRPLAPAPDPQNAEAYAPVGAAATGRPLLPAAEPEPAQPQAAGLTDELWREHVRRAEEYAANRESEQLAEDPGEGSARRAVERGRVQPGAGRSHPAVDRVPGRSRKVP